MHHRHAEESVRQADHKGHHIVIRTTYRSQSTAKPVTGTHGVDNDGQFHYHPVPTRASARRSIWSTHLIDTFRRISRHDRAAVTPRRDHVHEMPGMKGTKTRSAGGRSPHDGPPYAQTPSPTAALQKFCTGVNRLKHDIPRHDDRRGEHPWHAAKSQHLRSVVDVAQPGDEHVTRRRSGSQRGASRTGIFWQA